MGNSRYGTATLRPAKFDSDSLSEFIVAHLDSVSACTSYNRRCGKTVGRASYLRRLNRMATVAGARSLLHLLVWHELQYKGWFHAKTWQEQLVKLFTDAVASENPEVFKCLEQLWVMSREHGFVTLRSLADRVQIHEDDLYEHFSGFAAKRGIKHYSIRWLTFLYVMHRSLLVKPEFALPPSTSAVIPVAQPA